MHYIKSIPAADDEKIAALEGEGWKRLKEPKSIAQATLCAIPLSFVTMLISAAYCYLINDDFRNLLNTMFGNSKDQSFSVEFSINLLLVLYIVCIYGYVLLHELLHAVFVPEVFNKESKTFIGMNGMFGFVYTEEKIGRSRYLLISMMPFVLLSFAIPGLLWLFGIQSGFIAALSIINAGGACVDILNVLLVTCQVPGKGIVISSGMVTLYR